MAGEEKQLVVEETTVVPGKMEFRLISPTESNFLKHIEWNKEELLAAVRSKVALYEGIVYTEETVKTAKNDRAELNNLVKAIDERRKKVKEVINQPSVAFDFEKGDFVRDGSNKMVRADGREAYMQWCWKVVQTEREAFLAYSDEIGTEFEHMEDFPDRDSRESEIERTITDALLVHPATEYVRNFIFDYSSGDAVVSFIVKGAQWEEEETISTVFEKGVN